MFQRYGRNWKPRTLAVNRGYYANQILPWFRGRPIADITNADVREWFASLHKTPVAADQSAPVLSVIMTCAETYGYRPEGSNPCRGIRRYRRKGRERFLSEEEIRRLGRVLEHHEGDHPMYVAIIRLLLLIGCRRREIVTLRWKEYRDGHLHLEAAKTGPRMVWLSSPARRILEEQPRTSQWIFSSCRNGSSIHVETVECFWRRLRSKADLKDVRLHDLRHSCATYHSNQLYLLYFIFRSKIRNHIVTGLNPIPDGACRACRATPIIFQNRTIPVIASFVAVHHYPGGSVRTIS